MERKTRSGNVTKVCPKNTKQSAVVKEEEQPKRILDSAKPTRRSQSVGSKPSTRFSDARTKPSRSKVVGKKSAGIMPSCIIPKIREPNSMKLVEKRKLVFQWLTASEPYFTYPDPDLAEEEKQMELKIAKLSI